MLLEKTCAHKIKVKLHVYNKSNYLLLLMCFFASSCRTQELSTPASSMAAKTAIPYQSEVEEYLGISFTKCRNIHFYKPQELNLLYYITLMSFEVPNEELISLLEQSAKLPGYDEFKINPVHSFFLQEVGKKVDWWKPAELKNAVSAVRSWCAQYEGDKCFLYGVASAAFIKVKGGWIRMYVCYQTEVFPDMLEN